MIYVYGQIFEVVNSMKDLIDFGWEHNMRMGPIGKSLNVIFIMSSYLF